MKLLRLSSSNVNFKTIEFKDGLNILAGLQLTSDDKKTYNGIGKSFSLNLIHLMFGAKLGRSSRKEKNIYDFLSKYGSFSLEFSHNGSDYTIVKNFSQPHYHINGHKIAQKDYTKELGKRLLSIQHDPQISFRQLLNVFARRHGSTYYSDITTQQGMPVNDYNQMYVNLSLLKADTHLIRQKAYIKDKLTQLEKARKAVENYESLIEGSNVKDLKDELSELEKQKQEFVIAENYDKYKKQADEATVEINSVRNEIYSIQNQIIRKLESLEQAKFVDVDVEKIKKIYDEAKFFFSEKVSVRLDEARDFHQKLMEDRLKRLESDIELLKTQAIDLTSNLQKIEKHRDSILKDLNSKGALEEYNSIENRIRTLSEEIQELEKYRKVLDDFKREESELAVENAKIQAKGVQYIEDSKEYFETIDDKFRTIVKQFYVNLGGSLQITLSSDAKYLFNIDSHIPRDGSQGVNEVKIFCYDFLLYQLNPDLLGFIAHDGTIFSEMDPRQKSRIFKVALEFIRSHDLQYFVNIGQSSLEEVLDKQNKIGILTDEEKQEINDSVILKLYDKDPDNWLFGMKFG